MRRHATALEIYRRSPRELQIEPTFCPCKRRYTWEKYEKIKAQFPFALNYPALPSPDHFLDLTEEWMINVCKQMLELYAGVPEFTIKMFCKFLNLILICLQDFEDHKLISESFHRFYFGREKMAFDFNIGPTPNIMHGLHARTRFLHSYHQRTFKEMVQYNFIEGYYSSCFGPDATHQERFAATYIAEVERPLPPPLPANLQELNHQAQIRENLKMYALSGHQGLIPESKCWTSQESCKSFSKKRNTGRCHGPILARSQGSRHKKSNHHQGDHLHHHHLLSSFNPPFTSFAVVHG